MWDFSPGPERMIEGTYIYVTTGLGHSLCSALSSAVVNQTQAAFLKDRIQAI